MRLLTILPTDILATPRDWIATISSWPANFEHNDMKESGLQLSKLLRDPNGEYRCDIIIALTHSRFVSYQTISILYSDYA
jgi:hypothetical protein